MGTESREEEERTEWRQTCWGRSLLTWSLLGHGAALGVHALTPGSSPTGQLLGPWQSLPVETGPPPCVCRGRLGAPLPCGLLGCLASHPCIPSKVITFRKDKWQPLQEHVPLHCPGASVGEFCNGAGAIA